MEDETKKQDTSHGASTPPDGLQSALGALLSNPALMASISKIASGMPSQGAEQGETAATSTLPAIDPELVAKLPEMIRTFSPLLSGAQSSPKPTPPKKESPSEQRCALLLALKPFLSPERQSAADSLLRLSQLSDVLGSQGFPPRK